MTTKPDRTGQPTRAARLIRIAPEDLEYALARAADIKRLVQNEIRRLARRGEPITPDAVALNIVRRIEYENLSEDELRPVAKAAIDTRRANLRRRSQ
jgi:hypothetical protein